MARTRTPKPKKQKVPRPKGKDLRILMKGIQSPSTTNRVASLAYILQWYDNALTYVLSKGMLTDGQKKKLELAIKSRRIGVSSLHEGEKETAFLTAVRLFEKVCERLRPMSVDKAYQKYESQKGRLEKKQGRLEQKFGNALQMVEKGIGSKVKLEVADAEKERQFDPNLRKLVYNRQAVKTLAKAVREKGLLTVMVEEIPILSRYACLEPDGMGKYMYDPEKHVQAMTDLWKQFALYAVTPEAPKRLVRRSFDRPVQPKQVASQRPSHHHVPGKGKREVTPEGFAAGSVVAQLYDLLKDGTEKPLREVLKGLPVANPKARVDHLIKRGREHGTWNVYLTKNTIRLEHTKGTTA